MESLHICSFADLQKPQGDLDGKACAAVGQNGLMALYDTLFSQVKAWFLELLCIFVWCNALFCLAEPFLLFSKGLCSDLPALCLTFIQLDVTSAQLMVTDNDFRDPDFRRQLNETVNSLLCLKVVPIFNENDAISTRKAPYEVPFLLFYYCTCCIWCFLLQSLRY